MAGLVSSLQGALGVSSWALSSTDIEIITHACKISVCTLLHAEFKTAGLATVLSDITCKIIDTRVKICTPTIGLKLHVIS